MTIIIPSLLRKTIKEIERDISKVPNFVNIIQIDIADGLFVPDKYLHDPKEINKLCDGKEVEVHLMVKDPEKYISDWGTLNTIRRIIFHYEATNDHMNVIRLIREYGKEPVIALNPETDYRLCKPIFPYLKGIQIMSVYPGVQGRPFELSSPDRIDEVRGYLEEHDLSDKVDISVDGGLTPDTIGSCVFYGANRLCVGSYLMNSDDFISSYNRLNSVIESSHT